MKVAALAGIDEFKINFLADSFDVPIAPILEGKGRSFAAAFFHRALVTAARRMVIDLVRRAVHDVNAATVRSPPRNAGGEVFVGVSNAPVMLFFVFILRSVGRGIAAQPELLDERVALFV